MRETFQADLEEHIRRETPHLPEQDVAALTEIVALLVDVYEPLRIYLFGSKARGDFGPDSDFDLMVIVPDGAEGDRRDSKLAIKALWGTRTPKDVLVQTAGYFASRAHLRASLPGTILREGKLLYAHDLVLVTETRSWFIKAGDDLRAAVHLLSATPPFLASAVFHCQQAAEKALKGFLTWHDEPFRKTHNLTDVGGQCTAIDPTLGEIVQDAATLTDYAWKFRHPGGPDAPSEREAHEALRLARDVCEAVLNRLPPEVRP